MKQENIMPCYQPAMPSDAKVDEITNRLLTVLRDEFGFGTTLLGETQGVCDMDEKHKADLRAWVRAAANSDTCNSF